MSNRLKTFFKKQSSEPRKVCFALNNQLVKNRTEPKKALAFSILTEEILISPTEPQENIKGYP